jgi:hypothetical protein
MRHCAEDMGIEMHPWQQMVADRSLELVPRARGQSVQGLRLASSFCGVMVGRQTGKTTWCAARIALQALLPSLTEVLTAVGVGRLRPQHIAFTAQDRAAAIKRFEEHVDWIMSGELRKSVARVRRQRGDELVKFINGSEYSVVTPSATGARGSSLDLAIIDEALAHDSSLLAAIRPTMAQRDGASGCIGAQLVIVSNAGDERSTLLNGERERGRRAVVDGDRSRCWFEWSAADDADPYDRATWRKTIPTLDQPDGLSSEYLRLEAETMNADDFRREYLCMHTLRPEATLLSKDDWERAPADPMGEPVAFGVDAMTNGDAAAIVAAGPSGDEQVSVEVVEHLAGVDWLTARCDALWERWQVPFVIDALGPLSWLIPALERRGVEVLPVRTADLLDATAEFRVAVAANRIAHQPDPRLAAAVQAAKGRRVGDRTGFSRESSVDMSVLVAAALAVWATENVIQPPTVW